MNDPLEYATELALMCLAGMFHSRMNQKIRLEGGMSYGVDCQYIRNPQWGRMEITCFVQAEKALQAWKIIQSALNNAANNWTLEELNKTRTILVRNEQLREETSAQICAIRSYQIQTRGHWRSIEESCALWNQITLEEVCNVMKEVAKNPQLTLCVGAPRYIRSLGFTHAPQPQKFSFFEEN